MNETQKLEKLDKEILEKKNRLKEATLQYLMLKKESAKKESSLTNKISDIKAIISIQNDQLNHATSAIEEVKGKIKTNEDELSELNKLEEKQLDGEKEIHRKEIERIDIKKKELDLMNNMETTATIKEINTLTTKINNIQTKLNEINKQVKDKLKGDIKNRRNIISKNFVFLDNRKNINNISHGITKTIVHLETQINFHTKEYKKKIHEITLKQIETDSYYNTLINAKSTNLNDLLEDIKLLHGNVVNRKSLNWIKNIENKEEHKVNLCDEINKLNEQYSYELNQYQDLMYSTKRQYEFLLTDLSQKKSNEETKLRNLGGKEQKQLSTMYTNHKLNTDNIRKEKGTLHELIEELQKLNKQKYQLELTLNQFKLDIENKFAKLEGELQNANERLYKITSRIRISGQTKPIESQIIYESKLVTLRNTMADIQTNIRVNSNQLDDLERQLKVIRDKLWNNKKDLKSMELTIHDKTNQRGIIQKRIDKLKSA